MNDGLDLDALSGYLAPFSGAPFSRARDSGAPDNAASGNAASGNAASGNAASGSAASEPESGLAPGLRAELIHGGKSNLTYRLTDGSHDWVLRRPPLGHVLATAHDMAREYRVLSALAPTPVPVPATVTLCEDASVIGAPFYVMEHVEGSILRRTADTADLRFAYTNSAGEPTVVTGTAMIVRSAPPPTWSRNETKARSVVTGTMPRCTSDAINRDFFIAREATPTARASQARRWRAPPVFGYLRTALLLGRNAMVMTHRNAPATERGGRPLRLHADRNPGFPLELDWVRDLQVNKSAVERRAETIAKRRTVNHATAGIRQYEARLTRLGDDNCRPPAR